MSAQIDLADVGFTATAISPLTADQTGIVAAALDDPRTFPDGSELPLPWHWAHFTPRVATAELGPDGHPPVPRHVHERYPRRMWASGTLEAPGSLVVGEPAERRSRIVRHKESDGRSGPLLIVTVEHTYVQRGAEPLAETQTLVYRTQGDPVPLPVGDHRVDPSTATWTERRAPTPMELFRFSAITFNSHRIHYDETYAREVEGYPALVVHGPLTAMRVLASVARHTGRRPATFEYRAVAPLFVGLPSTIVGTRDGDDVRVEVIRNDGAVAMEAAATLGADQASRSER